MSVVDTEALLRGDSNRRRRKVDRNVGGYKIHEGGKNGSVEIVEGTLIRTISKRLGKDDRQMIPLKGISSVNHDRKRMKTVTRRAAAKKWAR